MMSGSLKLLRWALAAAAFLLASGPAFAEKRVALVLAREGIPVFIHGVTRDPARVTTREVLDALGIEASVSAQEALMRLETRRLVGDASVDLDGLLSGSGGRRPGRKTREFT